MIDLYAYDFDGTLIPYDSLNKFLRGIVLIRPLYISCILGLRILHLISSGEMKKMINRLVFKDSRCLAFAQSFAEQTTLEINWPKMCPPESKCVVLSASPACYMKYIGEYLNVDMISSEENEQNIFVHMYGNEKLRILYEKYPSTKYFWRYAASDSKSDLCWMELFEEYTIIGK